MSVYVALLGPLHDAAGMASLESQARNVEQLLEELSRRFGPDFGKKARSARIVLNGTAIQFQKGRKTSLEDGDEISLLFPVGGG